MYSRRHVLAAIGAVATAGCADAFSGGSGERDRVRLEELSVQNNHANDRRIQLALEADDEMLHLGTYDLDGGGESRSIDGEWDREARSYRVHAKLDGGEIRSEDLTDGVAEADCVRGLIRIDADGELTVWNGANCGSEADGGPEEI